MSDVVAFNLIKVFLSKAFSSLFGYIRRRGRIIPIFLISLPVLYWVYYSYEHYEFIVFISYFALLVAATAALANCISLKYTRDTVRPFLMFGGTINLGGLPEKRTLAFPITNSGSVPADNVKLEVKPFGIDEQISLENVSKKYAMFFDEPTKDSQEALILFPNATWQSVLAADLTQESDQELWKGLLNGNIKLRITISYSSFGRRHKTIQTLAFDELSLSKDEKRLYGLSVKPQKWV